MFTEYGNYDAVGLSELIAAGEVTPRDLIEAAIDRAEEVNPALNAIILKQYGRARKTADRQDLGGPFLGVPSLTKDLAVIEGDVASFGSVFFRDYVGEATDVYQKRFAAAGLIPIGRTNSPEFGLLPTTEPVLHGPTRNPWDLERSSAGSSGGAAAATAAGVVPLAHASDGGGSIRLPASACGVFGLKPSRGRMPRFPASPADYLSMDLCVSRSVRDTAALLDAVHGGLPGAAYHLPPPEGSYRAAVDTDPGRLRIAYTTTDFRGNPVDPECADAVTAAAELLEQAGHEVMEAMPDVDGDSLAESFLAIWESLAESVFALILEEVGKRRSGTVLRRTLGDWRTLKVLARLDKRKSGKDAFEPFTWHLAELSRRRTPAQLEAARTELQRISYTLGAFLEQYDVLLSPVLGSPPVALGEIDQNAPWDQLIEQLFAYVAFTPVANFSGLPAMSVPTHWSESGLPIGTHYMGRLGDEHSLLALAGQLERAVPWFDRRPPIR
ncbi:MAG: amidase family protein [Acidimicrobiia bacterium]|nr:amidase family protein [Acidimicrobiia bacterium]